MSSKLSWSANNCPFFYLFSRFLQDSADLLTEVEKSLTVQIFIFFLHFQIVPASRVFFSPFISRWRDTVCTVPPSTRSIWSESTSGTTWSLATLAGRLLPSTGFTILILSLFQTGNSPAPRSLLSPVSSPLEAI